MISSAKSERAVSFSIFVPASMLEDFDMDESNDGSQQIASNVVLNVRELVDPTTRSCLEMHVEDLSDGSTDSPTELDDRPSVPVDKLYDLMVLLQKYVESGTPLESGAISISVETREDDPKDPLPEGHLCHTSVISTAEHDTDDTAENDSNKTVVDDIDEKLIDEDISDDLLDDELVKLTLTIRSKPGTTESPSPDDATFQKTLSDDNGGLTTREVTPLTAQCPIRDKVESNDPIVSLSISLEWYTAID